MPIQFCCTQCGQPIEVDDEHANRSAACPYCEHVVRVPEQSTFVPGGAVSARPLGGPPAPPGPQVSGMDLPGSTAARGAWDPRRAANAVRLGNLALLCSGIAIAALLLITIMAFGTAAKHAGAPGAAPPSYEELARAIQEGPWGKYLVVANLGMMLSAFLGAGLATASLAHTRKNWRGWTALAICAGLLVCIFGAALLTALLQGVLD